MKKPTSDQMIVLRRKATLFAELQNSEKEYRKSRIKLRRARDCLIMAKARLEVMNELSHAPASQAMSEQGLK